MNPLTVLIIPFIVLPAFAAESDWPEFRGTTGQGISAAAGVPLKWGTTENVAWKVEIPGKGWSSPVVAAGENLPHHRDGRAEERRDAPRVML